MKPRIDIILKTLHVGKCRRVVTLAINGEDPAAKFLKKLLRDDINRFKALKTRIKTISDYETHENRITFRYVGDGIFEFKRKSDRLYAFYDQIEGEEQLILCTNGGTKNTSKAQSMDIVKAKARKTDYHAAKLEPSTTLYLEGEDL